MVAAVARVGWVRQGRIHTLAQVDLFRAALGWMVAAGIVSLAVVFDPDDAAVFADTKYTLLGVSAVALLVLAAGVVARHGADFAWHWWLDGPIVLWVLTNLVAYTQSPAREVSLHGEPLQRQGLLATLVYVVILYAVRLAGPQAPVPFAAALAGLAVAVYGAVQWVGLDPIWDELANGRVFSSIGQPNAFGAYMVLTLGFVVAASRSPSRATRLVGILGTTFVFGGIWLSFSRGAYLAVLVAVLVTGAAMARRTPLRSAVVVLLGISVLAGSLWLFPLTRPATGQVLERGATIVQPLDSSNSRRVDLWTVGIAMARDNPWVGIGQERYPVAFPAYAATELSPEGRRALAPFRPESPHNVYVAAAAGVGIPGGLAYLTIVGTALVMAWRLVRTRGGAASAAVLFAVVAHVVTDAFITAELAGSVLFWALLGWLAAQTRNNTDKDRPGADAGRCELQELRT